MTWRLGAVVGFLDPIGFAFDGDDLGVVHQTVDQRDDTGGVGEHLAPLGERAIGGDHGAFVLIAAGD